MKPFWNDKKLTEEEKNALLVETCRKVFSTDEGRVVLNMLLTDLHLVEPSPTEQAKALNEYAKFFIRRRLGVGDTKALTDFIAQTAAAGGGE
jgi:hypothetical protein